MANRLTQEELRLWGDPAQIRKLRCTAAPERLGAVLGSGEVRRWIAHAWASLPSQAHKALGDRLREDRDAENWWAALGELGVCHLFTSAFGASVRHVSQTTGNGKRADFKVDFRGSKVAVEVYAPREADTMVESERLHERIRQVLEPQVPCGREVTIDVPRGASLQDPLCPLVELVRNLPVGRTTEVLIGEGLYRVTVGERPRGRVVHVTPSTVSGDYTQKRVARCVADKVKAKESIWLTGPSIIAVVARIAGAGGARLWPAVAEQARSLARKRGPETLPSALLGARSYVGEGGVLANDVCLCLDETAGKPLPACFCARLESVGVTVAQY